MSQMTRRCFLGTMVAGAGAQLLGARLPSTRPNVTVGVISDIHITMPKKGGTPNTAMLLKTLTFFREQDVDVVMIAGDLTNYGLMKELRPVAEAWYSVFPGDKGLNGKKVERVIVTGNHDTFGYLWKVGSKNVRSPEAESEGLYRDVQAHWQELFHEPYEPIFIKKVKGYSFIGAHWTAHCGGRLAAFLEKNKADLTADRPFFYAQHAHPQDTVYGPWAWGAWDDRGGAARAALGAYPNAVAFSGHSHCSLTDERSVWQGTFTSVGTASLSYCALPHGRENGTTEAFYYRRMQRVNGAGTQQGLLMKVWDDVIVLERRDFTRMEKLDEDWVIPVLHGPADPRPFAHATRAQEVKAPQFPKGAKIKTSWTTGKDAKGEEERRFVVSFPAPVSTGWRDRIFDYEVRIEIEEDDTIRPWATKRVYPAEPFRSVKHLPKDASCVFGFCELPAIRKSWSPDPYLRVVVTPFNCFGAAGKPLMLRYSPEK